MKRMFSVLVLCAAVASSANCAVLTGGDNIVPPYSLSKLFERSEELFKENNFRDALVFYYEALKMTNNPSTKAKLHFRIGECLESVKRYEFASYHYKLAVSGGKLPELLESRSIMKLEHLPDLAQKEEAERLYNNAVSLYRRKNIKAALNNYLESIKLMPVIMERNDEGLVDDGIKYLSLLSESKEREPDRLLKLASLYELQGQIEKSSETLQQIVIIYPGSDEAIQAEEKLAAFESTNTAYLEPVAPPSDLDQIMVEEVLFEDVFEFTGVGATSRSLGNCAYSFKAYNERAEIPNNRFEVFSVSFGSGSEEKEFIFLSSEGIKDKDLKYETDSVLYTLHFSSVDKTAGYIQDLYGDGNQSVELFSKIGVKLKIERKAY